MKPLRYIPSILAAAAIMLTAACERRPLIEPDNVTHVSIEIDSRNINNISGNIYNDKIEIPDIDPEVMHVLFFDKESDNLLTEAYISNRNVNDEGNTVISGTVRLHPGEYRMMAYNFGTESTLIRDYNQWSKAQAYTNSVSDNILSAYKSRLPEEESVVYEPDHLHLSVSPDLYLPYHTGLQTIETTARTIIDTYYLQIKVDGLEYVSSAQAFLSGMTAGNSLSENRRMDEEQSTVFFYLRKSDDKGTPVICNIFSTFGHLPDVENKLEVTFDLRTVDGKTVQRTFDITGLFKTEDAIERHWLLLEETIKIDPPDNIHPDTGGGMDPSVNEWEDENHEILL